MALFVLLAANAPERPHSLPSRQDKCRADVEMPAVRGDAQYGTPTCERGFYPEEV
jgi:hypothetical protein